MNPEPREFKFLGTVEAVFSITGRGVVIVPVWLSTHLTVRNGDPVQLRRADGKFKNTRITSVEFLKRAGEGCQCAFMLPTDVAKDEITDGMEIWV